MFGLPEHWVRRTDADEQDLVELKREIGLVTGTEITVSRGKIWLNQETVAGDVASVRQIAGLLHQADAIATLQRLSG